MNTLVLKAEGDTHIVATRKFAAPAELVYRAHTEPKLIQQWLLGPDGWTMPVCINENKPGGHIRYEWRNAAGHSFHITGEIIELVPFSKIIHVEVMHLPDPMPENRVETHFTADGTGTLMTMRMSLPDAKTRDTMVAGGMAQGMEASYARLEKLI